MDRIWDSESNIWVVYGFEGGFWLDGFEGMWIGFCRGWVGGVWIGGEVRSSNSNRGWIGGEVRSLDWNRGWIEGEVRLSNSNRGWIVGEVRSLDWNRGCIGGEVRLSDWNELKQWRETHCGWISGARRTVGGARTGVRERVDLRLAWGRGWSSVTTELGEY